MQHLRDDQAAGWLGYQGHMSDPRAAYEMEERAYTVEIEYAESIGDYESADILRHSLEEERSHYLGDPHGGA